MMLKHSKSFRWKCPFEHRGLRLKDVWSLDTDAGMLGTKIRVRDEKGSHEFSERKRRSHMQKAENTALP